MTDIITWTVLLILLLLFGGTIGAAAVKVWRNRK